EVGDEMQYITKDGVYQNSSPDYILDKITGKVVNSNSTDYTILRKTDKPATTWPYHHSATYSTHTYNFTDNSFFNTRMPEEYLQNYGIYYDPANQDNCVTTPFYSLKSYMISGNMYFSGFFYVPFQNTYKWGLGRIDYYLVDGEPKVYEKELVYYRRGNITCGTLYNLNVGKLGSKEDITIYPNPASDFLSITSPQPITRELFLVDVLGKEQIRLQFNEKTQIDTRNIPNGVYFLHFKSKSDQSCTSKIFIQH
ncbi:MAG TPA: T9SS type A sorting domain-containing protein, partial [Flavipsychrobacter sp.]|nr:T9SS type A sorting domain-containing protein [Flavipsychrobacter sp.]